MKNNTTLFLLYVSLMLIINFLQQEFVLLPELQNIDIIGEDSRLYLIERFQRVRWLAYLASFLTLILRLSLVSLCFYIGGFFSPQMPGIKFKNWWEVALYSQPIMICYSLFLCINNVLSEAHEILNMSKYPSLLFLAGDDIEAWVKLPLAAINIFEMAYWCVLSLCIGKLAGTSFGRSFKFVMSTYGVGYLFYIALLMFLMLYLA